ncbi:ATP-binding cassette domain-containing protein [Atopobacter sp. AH10]|uniref:ATP-binding cassette domain-containing protein n=1 Tax=Atopobacter sp. AH10 TaxID=2315861 RepID=UPI000EF24B4A|nr:ATP-binding cassette domain-containing protein [Atopobacter sp. AH10]RLK63345.1 ATP-binding cassette domain-containing protein [Atopobacter sp. AH10]
MLQVSDWTVCQENSLVLDHLSFQLAKGKLLAILGPTGVGKSTLLLSLAGLLPHEAGDISPTIYPHQIGFLFQESSLFPWMTVEENIRLGFHKQFLDKREVDRLLFEALERLDLLRYKDRYPHQLSLGQEQAVALARILVKHPPYIFLDEPTGVLSPEEAKKTWKELEKIKEEQGATIILATHRIHEALVMADYVAVLRKGRLLTFEENPLRDEERQEDAPAYRQYYRKIEKYLGGATHDC